MINCNEQIYSYNNESPTPFCNLAYVAAGVFHPGLCIVERIREYCVGVSIKGRNLQEIGW